MRCLDVSNQDSFSDSFEPAVTLDGSTSPSGPFLGKRAAVARVACGKASTTNISANVCAGATFADFDGSRFSRDQEEQDINRKWTGAHAFSLGRRESVDRDVRLCVNPTRSGPSPARRRARAKAQAVAHGGGRRREVRNTKYDEAVWTRRGQRENQRARARAPTQGSDSRKVGIRRRPRRRGLHGSRGRRGAHVLRRYRPESLQSEAAPMPIFGNSLLSRHSRRGRRLNSGTLK